MSVIEKAKQRFKLAEEYFASGMQEAEDDIRFSRLNEQWPADVKEKREREGRPCLTINRLPTFIRQVVNDARQNSPSIKIHPVDSNSDPETAEVVNGLIRNIESTSNAEVAYDTALESAVTCGMGYFRVDVDYACDDVFDLDIQINRIVNPLSVYPDPHSMEIDASDWAYCFVVDEMSHEAFKAEYPNADISNWEGESDGWLSEDTVRVCEYWTRDEEETEILMLQDGTILDRKRYEENKGLFQSLQIVRTRKGKTFRVKQIVMTGKEVLEENDWPGKFIPIIPCYGDEVVVDGKRHFLSLVRQAKDSQRNFNYWRTSATERVALASKVPWIGPTGAFDTDIRKWETANTEPHPYIEYDGPTPPQQSMPSMVDAGSMQEALNAADDLKSIMGIFDAALGARSNETSGRAIIARQREADTGTFHFIDNLSRAIRYAGRVILDLIPHVYSKPRTLRILGYDGEPQSVQVNAPFEVNGVNKLHDLTKGKYDLVVSAGPSFTTKREEAATQMVELLRSFPQAAPIIGDLVAKNLDWPGADEIAKRLKVMLPPEIQKLTEMDGLPPEAQAAIAAANKQVADLMGLIEQGKGMLAEKDQQLKELEVAANSKQADIQAREMDSQRKFEAQMAKIQADVQIAAQKIQEDQRETILNTITETMKQRLDYLTQKQELGTGVVSQLESKLAEYEAMLARKDKVIEIQAPSGRTYKGAVINGEIAIETPSGEVYNGIVEER